MCELDRAFYAAKNLLALGCGAHWFQVNTAEV